MQVFLIILADSTCAQTEGEQSNAGSDKSQHDLQHVLIGTLKMHLNGVKRMSCGDIIQTV